MHDEDVCQEQTIDKTKVAKIKDSLISDKAIDNLSETFKALADGTRIKIVFALLHNELCVCEIAEVVGLSQSAVSHQLRKLKDMHLVKRRKSAKMVYYSLDDDHIVTLLRACAEHVQEELREPIIIPDGGD